MKRVVISGGDIGGARGLIPVIARLCAEDIPVTVIKHGYLGDNISSCVQNEPETLPEDMRIIEHFFREGRAGIYLFSTSGWDAFALSAARVAKNHGVPVVYLLDSWMNYRMRVELDGLPPLHVDAYAVMDELAFEGALRDGIPQSCLKITGHPGLSALMDEFGQHLAQKKERLGRELKEANKRLVVFLSEPVESDQGASQQDSPIFRGYTEKTVLKLFCENMQKYDNEVRVMVVPHPREDANEVLRYWNMYHGELEGTVFRPKSGREGVFIADGVCGMASALLYEAWLIGKPVLSLQPGLCTSELSYLKAKKGCYFIAEEQIAEEIISMWMEEVLGKKPDIAERYRELESHRNAPQEVCRLLQHFLLRSH